MKKVLVLGVLGVFALVACKKDYTCACSVSGQTLNVEIQKASKKDAQSACDDAETTYKIADPNASCSL